MSARKKTFRRFCLDSALILTISLFLCFCINALAGFIRPRLISSYVLAADENGEYIYKTKGFPDYLGMAADLFLGGNFAMPSSAFSAISGNFTTAEKTDLPDDTPTPAPQPKPLDVMEKTTLSGGKITINNETSYSVSEQSVAASAPVFSASDKDEPQILIIHSHATESYAPTDKYRFTHSSEDRSTDRKYNMVRIGAELKSELEKRNIKSVHITDLFDYPEYNNSYSRSCAAAEKALEDNPSIKIVLDLHRDSITNSEGKKTKLTTTIDGEKVAQVMLVVGTDELGLKHDNWKTNLKFAAHFQKFLLAEEENFARPINLRTSRFNGHTAPGAVIVEVGTGANTIEEALSSVKYIANAVENLIDSYR